MDSSSPLDPYYVADSFVKLYYSVLKDAPKELHRFYNDNSRIGRPRHGVTPMTVSTLRDIKEDLNPLSFGNFKSCEVTSFDLQKCSIGSLIVVHGYFTSDERLDRRFIHIFFLALEDSRHIVSNDMLQFVDERKTKGGILVSEASDPTVNNDVVEQRVLELKTIIKEDVPDSAGFVPSSMPAPKDQGEFSNWDPIEDSAESAGSSWEHFLDREDCVEIEDASDSASIAPSTVPAPLDQGQRSSSGSFIEIEDSPESARFLPSPIPAPLDQGHCSTWDPIIEIEDVPESAGSAPSSMPVPIDQGQRLSCDTSPGTQANAIAVRTDDTGNGNNQQSQVYIPELDPDTTPGIIKETFKQFGALKIDGVQFVTNKDGRRCFSVRFEEASAAQKAVEASPIEIKGQVARVELRSTRIRTLTEMYKLKKKSNTTTQSKP